MAGIAVIRLSYNKLWWRKDQNQNQLSCCDSHKQSSINHFNVTGIVIIIFCFLGILVCVYVGLIGWLEDWKNNKYTNKYKIQTHAQNERGKSRTKALKLKGISNTSQSWSHNTYISCNAVSPLNTLAGIAVIRLLFNKLWWRKDNNQNQLSCCDY